LSLKEIRRVLVQEIRRVLVNLVFVRIKFPPKFWLGVSFTFE
jgi:hypothetical protein